MRLFVSILCSLFFVTFALSAQVGSPSSELGTITGRITGSENGEALIGATVVLEGTKKGATTDTKGRYSIKNIKPGTYNLRVSYISYQTKQLKDIDVKAGQTLTQNIVLSLDTKNKTKEVVVVAKAIKETQAAAVAERKNSSQVSEVVSQEEIKKAPDSDAGQALKRVSGVTLVGDKFVYVRGISDRYNGTTLNGVAVTSTEPDKKAFAFDMFPTEFLQSASVTKSFTPDLPGNFAGGLVQLNTIDFPQGYSLKVNTSLSANDNVTGKANQFQTYTGGSTDWLGFDNGARQMPSLLPNSRNEMDQILRDIRQYYRSADPQYEQTANRWETMAKDYNPGLWNRRGITAGPNGGFGVSFSNLYSPFDNDLGVIASVNYSNGVSIANKERRGISSTQEELFYTNGTISNRSVNLGAMLNISTKLGDGNTLSLRNLYNNSSDDEVVSLGGYNVAQTRDLRLLSMDFTQKSLLSSQLIGEHVLGFLDNVSLDWRVGYSVSERDQPDFRRLRYSRDRGASEDLFIADIQALPQGDGTLAGRFKSYLKDDALNGSVNITIPYEGAKIKFGGLAEDRNRVFNTRSFTYVQSKIFSGGEQLSDTTLSQSPDVIFNPANFGRNGLGVSEDSKPTDSYTANERLYAGYAMVDFPFTIADQEFRVITGARIEDNTTRLETPASINPVTNVPDSLIKTDLHTFDVLPSLNLIYKYNDKTNFRASATQTLARPSLREFAPFAFFDFQDLAVVRGNKDLTRALIQNYDLRWEYFPGYAQVFSAGVFYKSFKNAIEETIVPTASEIERSFQNASGMANNYGFELEARKNFDFISDYFQNLLFSVNYSWIRSEVEVQQGLVTDRRALWGQSPYSLNLGLFFAEPEWKTQFNMSYNISGKRIIQVGQLGRYEFADPHVYEMPRDVIDISISQPIGDAWNLRFTARDLLNQPLQWIQGNSVVMSQIRGRTFGLSVSYTFR